MGAGIDVILYRPDAELRRLAARAVDLGVGTALTSGAESAGVIAELETSEPGRQWLAELEAVKDSWFYYSTGSGYCYAKRAWIDDLRPPFTALADYVRRVERGEDPSRPLEALRAERERIALGYRDLFDGADAAAFDSLLALSRQVFPFVENHNFYVEHWHHFYVEHWHHSIFFNKTSELGAVLVAAGLLEADDDIFFLHRYEVYKVLYEAEARWALGPADAQRIHPAGGSGPAPPDLRRVREVESVAGPGRPTGEGDRADHGHPVWHQHGDDRPLARGRQRRQPG